MILSIRHEQAMDPQKRFLFASGDIGIAGAAIDGTTEGLTALSGSPFFPGAASGAVSFGGSGKFLYASQSGTDLLWGFAVDAASGNLTTVPGSPFLCGPLCYEVAGDAAGQYVYAGALYGVQAYKIADVNASVPISVCLSGGVHSIFCA
jgi:hypothetical protein